MPTATAAPGTLQAVQTVRSLTGVHHWYQQIFHGVPVLDGYYVQHVRGAASTVDDGRVAVSASLVTTPRVAAGAATAVVTKALGARAAAGLGAAKANQGVPTKVGTATLAIRGGASSALVWQVESTSAEGLTRTLVDASTGAVREVKVMSKYASGTAKVFRPNPVVTLRNESLKDKNDTNQTVLNPAYRTITLKGLKGNTLSGPWAKVVRANIAVATSPTRTFSYQRADDRFEQVNAYAAVDLVQRYIRGLGFTNANNEAQDLEINTFTGDNSFYSPADDTITLGSGGVDDAEDMEVVWHEYGHALQDAIVPGFGSSSQAGAMGEGFGDYLALTMSQPYSGGFDLPCIMDWDSTSYTSTVPHCLRRTDTGKTTDDIVGEVHDDGEIWSGALWGIYQALGRSKSDKVILEATYDYTPGTSFAAAANKTVAAANALYGTTEANKVRNAFRARKIL